MSATPAATADAPDLTPEPTLRVTVDDDGRSGALYVARDGRQARVHEHDCLYVRTVVNERQGERFVEYRRRTVTQFVDIGGAWYVELADDYDLGRTRLPLREVLASLATGRPIDASLEGATVSQTSPEGFDVHDTDGTWRTWEPVRDHERTPETDLTFARIQGRGSRTTVNAFLEGESADVDHALGSVHAWKAAFVARDADGELVSALVAYFYNPSQNGSELCITRLANRADAPDNTSSWMLANVRDWARDQEYDTLATYAGVGANLGTCYSAAGFEPRGEPVEREGASWNRGDDADHDADEPGDWQRQKWVCDL